MKFALVILLAFYFMQSTPTGTVRAFNGPKLNTTKKIEDGIEEEEKPSGTPIEDLILLEDSHVFRAINSAKRRLKTRIEAKDSECLKSALDKLNELKKGMDNKLAPCSEKPRSSVDCENGVRKELMKSALAIANKGISCYTQKNPPIIKNCPGGPNENKTMQVDAGIPFIEDPNSPENSTVWGRHEVGRTYNPIKLAVVGVKRRFNESIKNENCKKKGLDKMNELTEGLNDKMEPCLSISERSEAEKCAQSKKVEVIKSAIAILEEARTCANEAEKSFNSSVTASL